MPVNVILNNVANLQDTTTAQTIINSNSATIVSGFSDTLNIDGDSMQGTLDMNSNQILNLPAPSSLQSPLRLQDAATLNGEGTIVTGVPSGGTTGQVLAKNSNTSYDTKWASVFPEVNSINGLTGALTLTSTGSDVITSSGTNINIGNPGGFVNKFRNAGMDIWQRGTSVTATTSGSYTADGWIVLPTGASVVTTSASNTRTGALSINALKITGASSVTDVIIKQRIESYIAKSLSGQIVTIQAQVYNSTGSSVNPLLTVKHASTQDNWSTSAMDVNAVSLQACSNGNWTQVAYSFTASPSSGNGLEISFDFGNNFNSSSNYVMITELDIRVTPGTTTSSLNSTPPPVELRPVYTEMLFCQRYFWSYLATSSSNNYAFGGFSLSSTGGFAIISLPVSMRIAPTSISNSSVSGFFFTTGAGVPVTTTALALNTSSINSISINATVASGLTTGQGGSLGSQSNSAQLFILGSEL